MKKLLGQITTFGNLVVGKTKVRRGMIAVLAVFFLLHFYFVRELLVAELLFGLGFAVLLALGGPAYLLGSVCAPLFQQPRRNQYKDFQSSREERIF